MAKKTPNVNAAFEENPDLYRKLTRAVPRPEKLIGIDTKETIYDNITATLDTSSVDISALNNFTNLTQSRNTIYDLLDTMCEDSTIATILETYAENITETNDSGRVVWCESDNANVGKFVTFLLDSMNVDKNIYKWAYSLCKYGDLYLRLYRLSEFTDALLDAEQTEETEKVNKQLNESLAQTLDKDNDQKETLTEDVILKAFSKKDRFVHYVEMVPNPAEMFELTKFGKTYAYIKAPLAYNKARNYDSMTYHMYNYNFSRKDVEVYSATNFVHAALEDNVDRNPEQVKIFLGKDEDETQALSYHVKRGQSLLYSTFKIWREMMLLENSMLLNRLTKSSFVRIINVEVGDMPKEQVGPHLAQIKNLIELKSALNTGTSMSEYTNPGPIENSIYVPTHDQKGTISISEVGGDTDVKGIADINYFKNKLYASLRVPKQYLGDTDDAAGFSGGQSLALISANFAKSIKRIQNTIIQALTDAINLMLLDKNLDSYINKFTIKMVTPSSQEERDRKEDAKNNIGLVQDITGLLTDIETESTKLKVLKILLQNIVDEPEIMQILQDEIDKIEDKENKIVPDNPELEMDLNDNSDEGKFVVNDLSDSYDAPVKDFGLSIEEPSESSSELSQIDTLEQPPVESSEMISELPSPEALGLDFTDNT